MWTNRVLLLPLSVDGHSGGFHVLAITSDVAVNILCTHFCVDMFSLLSRAVAVSWVALLTVWDLPDCFQQWLYHSTSRVWGFLFLRILTNLVVVVFIIAVPVDAKWHLVVVLICVSLMTKT